MNCFLVEIVLPFLDLAMLYFQILEMVVSFSSYTEFLVCTGALVEIMYKYLLCRHLLDYEHNLAFSDLFHLLKLVSELILRFWYDSSNNILIFLN